MNPGKELAALRRNEEKVCPLCGALFTAQIRVVNCKKCMNNLRQKKFQAKKKLRVEGI